MPRIHTGTTDGGLRSPGRRRFLGGMGATCLALATGVQCAAVERAMAAAGADGAPFRLRNASTNEAHEFPLFTGGRWNEHGLMVADWLFRDWRDGVMHPCDRKLYAGLYVLQRTFGGREFVLTSGFRTRSTNALLRKQGYKPADNSQHLVGRAADFHVPGVSTQEVARAAWEMRLGGVARYASKGFVHLDTRGEPVRWGSSF